MQFTINPYFTTRINWGFVVTLPTYAGRPYMVAFKSHKGIPFLKHILFDV